MRFSIGNNSLRQFVKALHSLAKIGEEIYFEWINEGLTVRSVNTSRSAYACFTFFTKFFDKSFFEKSTSSYAPCRWKIPVKSCLTVFRSQASIEKKVERCRMSLDAEEARLDIQFFCKQGIIKTYRLTIIDCESLQAVFQLKDSMSNLTVSSKLLSDSMMNFQPSHDEVTLCAREEGIEFKNYVEDESERGKTISTSFLLLSGEFEEYNIVKNVAITFCIKELKALLSFGEPVNLPLKIYFEGAGRPVIFTYDSDAADIASHFVLATLTDCPGPSQSASTQASTQASRKAQSTQQWHRLSERQTTLERTESCDDVDVKTFIDMANDDEETENAMVELESELSHYQSSKSNGVVGSPKHGVSNENYEPLSKRRCTGLFASILEEGDQEMESLSCSLASQRTVGIEKVLVSDSDPED